MNKRDLLTCNHWGTYRVDVEDGRVIGLRDFEEDTDPSMIGHGIVDVLDGPLRIKAPMVRKSWLEGGPGTAGDKRGEDSFVQVNWDEANRLVAKELNRVRTTHGNQAIFSGSYGMSLGDGAGPSWMSGLDALGQRPVNSWNDSSFCDAYGGF